jgi:hypothetical protein
VAVAVGNGCGWGVVSLNCFFELCRERRVKREKSGKSGKSGKRRLMLEINVNLFYNTVKS